MSNKIVDFKERNFSGPGNFYEEQDTPAGTHFQPCFIPLLGENEFTLMDNIEKKRQDFQATKCVQWHSESRLQMLGFHLFQMFAQAL